MRAVMGSSFLLTSPTFVGADQETPTNATGTPACTLTRADGTALAAATVTQPNPSDLGKYVAQITTVHTSQLDALAVNWVATVAGQTQVYRDRIDVVGSRLVTLAQIRAMPGVGPAAVHPTAMVDRIRDRLETMCEDACGQAFSPRYALETRFGSGTASFLTSWLYPRLVRSVSYDGTSQDVAGYSFDSIGLIASAGSFPRGQTVAVGYEHGADTPRADLVDELLEAIRSEVLASANPVKRNLVTEQVDGQGSFNYPPATRKLDAPTGYPGLDAVLRSIGLRSTGVA